MQTSEYKQRLLLIFEPFLDGPDSKGEFEAFLDHVTDPGHKEEIRAFVEGEWKNRSGKKVVEMSGEAKDPGEAPAKYGASLQRSNPHPKKSNRLYKVLVISMLIIAILLFVYWLRSPDVVLP